MNVDPSKLLDKERDQIRLLITTFAAWWGQEIADND